MKKSFALLQMLTVLLCFSGCSMAGEKTTGLSAIYGTAVVLSLLVLAGYSAVVKKKDGLFVLLFSAVLVVNIGYFSLSVSGSLTQARWANRVAYLGSVFLPAIMLLIILEATNVGYPRWLPALLTGIGAAVFLIAASPGVLTVYYREVSFVTVNGTGMLQKVYGPLHFLYGVYLLAYFASMVVVILYAAAEQKTRATGHVVILAIAVFVNLGVWFIEQLVRLEFEVLAVSYIISELFLLGLHLVLTEQRQLQERTQACEPLPPEPVQAVLDERQLRYLAGVERLTQTEKLIYEAYVKRMTTKEILAQLNIKENTLKFHNKNLYQKLGVSSRKELQAIAAELAGETDTEDGGEE